MSQLSLQDLAEAGSFKKAGGSNLVRVKSDNTTAIIFQAILNEDADGAPDCYAPTHPPGLDKLENGTSNAGAGFDPKGNNGWRWAGLISMTIDEAKAEGVLPRLDQTLAFRDRDGRFPLFQPNMQFYISRTSIPANPSLPRTDQAKYWNARTVSYGALTPALTTWGVGWGDFGLAIRIDTGVFETYLYADGGHQNKVGESSRQLFRKLFPQVNQENHPVAFMVFPGSAIPRAGTFLNDPKPTIRPKLADLSLASDLTTVIGLMASGRKYRDYNVGTDPRNVGPLNMDSPQAQTIARALQQLGYDPEAARKRQMSELMDEAKSQIGRDAQNLGSFQIPRP